MSRRRRRHKKILTLDTPCQVADVREELKRKHIDEPVFVQWRFEAEIGRISKLVYRKPKATEWRPDLPQGKIAQV